MSEAEFWTVYESELFTDEVSKYLSAIELDALRHQLARDPVVGKPVPSLDPLMSLEFAGATVLYAVNPSKRTIILLQIGKATGKPIEIDAAEKSRLKELLGLLRKGGYIAAGKEFFEWLIEILKDWLGGV